MIPLCTKSPFTIRFVGIWNVLDISLFEAFHIAHSSSSCQSRGPFFLCLCLVLLRLCFFKSVNALERPLWNWSSIINYPTPMHRTVGSNSAENCIYLYLTSTTLREMVGHIAVVAGEPICSEPQLRFLRTSQ